MLVVVLALAAGGLGVLNAAQGPRLDGADVNARALIERPGQRLVLRANQPVAQISADQVVVVPAAGHTATVDGSSITIRFTDALDYDTEYTVTLKVRGASTGAEADLRYSFATPDVELYSLLRRGKDVSGADEDDVVLRHSLSGAVSNDEVFAAARIQEYLALDAALAVVTLDDANSPTLAITWPDDGATQTVDTGRSAVVRDLHAADSGTLFGYVAGSRDDSALFVYDLENPSGIPVEITGFDGRPLPVDSWTFVPGTTSLVVQGDDQQLYLVDPLTDDDPAPLGQHDEIRGFVPGTLQLVVADPDRGSLIDLTDGSTETLSLPEPTIDADLYPTKLVVLSSDSYLQLLTEVDDTESGSTSNSVISLTTPQGTTEVYRTLSGTSRIADFCLSPTAKYLAVELVPNASRADGYASVPGYEGTSTIFVRLSDGDASRGVSGSQADWCRGDP